MPKRKVLGSFTVRPTDETFLFLKGRLAMKSSRLAAKPTPTGEACVREVRFKLLQDRLALRAGTARPQIGSLVSRWSGSFITCRASRSRAQQVAGTPRPPRLHPGRGLATGALDSYDLVENGVNTFHVHASPRMVQSKHRGTPWEHPRAKARIGTSRGTRRALG